MKSFAVLYYQTTLQINKTINYDITSGSFKMQQTFHHNNKNEEIFQIVFLLARQCVAVRAFVKCKVTNSHNLENCIQFQLLFGKLFGMCGLKNHT